MKSYAIALTCLFFLVGLLSVSQADSHIVQHAQVTIFVKDVMYNILGSKTFTYDATSAIGPTQPEPLSLWFTLGIDPQPGKTLFGDVPLIPNVGKTICLNSACAYPSWSAFVVTLTDGRNDRLSGTFTLDSLLGTVSSTTTHVYESSFVPGGVSHDFKGDRIGKICIRVDSASVEQIPVVVTTVPEPCSALTMLGGLGCAAALWKRRRKYA